MNYQEALHTCRTSGMKNWELVAFAQKLVFQNMKYSVTNSFDKPKEALEHGQGYCWHRSSVLNMLLLDLGFNSRLVHAYKNVFTESEIMGVTINDFVSGHVWCRVMLDGVEKDVCPGNMNNTPGVLHFKPIGKVHNWNKCIEFFTYYGSALVNRHRGKKYEKVRVKQESRWIPEKCPCKKTSCIRNKKCDECREYHYAKNGLPACER